jgi:import inner membrane translocase subunit TIM9
MFLLILHSMYNNLVSRCFDGCVTGFRSKTLGKSEIDCVEHCASRYVKMTQRVGLRFAEHQALNQKKQADAAAAVSK